MSVSPLDDAHCRPRSTGLLSIVIKAFNEEGKIDRAILSALAAAPEVLPRRLEVIVADSASTDQTVAFAARHPVRVVRLRHAQARGCGAGVQLGYEWARGDLVYLMDGDMVLEPGFLAEALACLDADPSLAGVGGAVVDLCVRNGVDRIRVNNRSGRQQGHQPWLEGGGLYRRAAIDSAGGYAAHPGLRGYEEAELGMRLGAAGWRLLRLQRPAVAHEGHALGTWALLRRHWRSRRAMSAGVLLRLSAGKPWFGRALRMHVHPLALALWWVVLTAIAGAWSARVAAVAGLAGALVLLAALVWRKRDLGHALTSVVGWHYHLAAILVGLFEPVRARDGRLDADLVRDSAPGAAPAGNTP